MLLPSNVANPASMMAQALSIYTSLIGNKNGNGKEAVVPIVQERSRYQKDDGSANQHNTEEDSVSSAHSASKDDFLPHARGFSLQSPPE